MSDGILKAVQAHGDVLISDYEDIWDPLRGVFKIEAESLPARRHCSLCAEAGRYQR